MKKVIFVLVLLGLMLPSISLAVVELKFANYFPVPAPQSKICEEIIKELEEKSQGELKIKYFPAGTLLTAPKIYEGVLQGVVDIGFSNIGYTFGRFKFTEAMDLPLGFPNGWVANHVANDFFRQYKPKEWDEVHMLSMHTSPVNVIMTATKPVKTLDDLKGMTLRGLGYIAEVVTALGATPRSIPTPESYEAVQKKVIDGLMIPLETLKSFRFAEVNKYVTECWPIGQVYTFYLIMNKNTWNKLPPNIQKIFNEYPFEEKLAKMWNEVDIDGKKLGQEKGLEFIQLEASEIPKWKKAVEPVIEKYIKGVTSAGYKEQDIKDAIGFIQKRIEFWTQKQKESGIKSPTGPDEVRFK